LADYVQYNRYHWPEKRNREAQRPRSEQKIGIPGCLRSATRGQNFLDSTYGVEKNAHANLLVQNEVTMDDLFA
jgi:hypothetical protein